ncbi:hypothetical protein OSTOST_24961 [Ostertagia ostertagi]
MKNGRTAIHVLHNLNSIHKENLLQILPLSLVFVGMIAFNNLCLKHVGVSFLLSGTLSHHCVQCGVYLFDFGPENFRASYRLLFRYSGRISNGCRSRGCLRNSFRYWGYIWCFGIALCCSECHLHAERRIRRTTVFPSIV